ncbi:MAG: 3-oxoacyl-[acyl-carrier-protein] reductase [Clostridia bacterium]|nr:3-oxoacyl-[acyl-carrier-protein] reductase [Clostridia bacterium]
MTDKTVIVTGAARGIGLAIAKGFAARGWNVALNYRSDNGSQLEALEAVRAAAAPDVEAELFRADVSKADECAAMVNAVTARFGGIRALINNAGITRDGLLMRMSEEQFDAVIDCNLKSVYNMCKAVVPVMMKARAGRIINISSVVGLHGNAGQTNYAASKAAIIGFTKSLAKEIGSRGITVNAIAPGYIETDMTDALSDEARKNLCERIALRRTGKPEDIANAAAFLASDDASYITGETLTVDGAMSL